MSELFLFPYEKIGKGSRVAIYGAGLVAEDYAIQLKANNYCELVFIAASDYKDNKRAKRLKWSLVSPDEFQHRTDYDYVVVATMLPEYREEMKQTLRTYGIAEEKIITDLIMIQPREKTYSQHGEDLIIYNALCHMDYFRDGKLPSYIDIGAHHPYDISNTALFYRLGCRGINIEANPELIKEFEKERPDDVNLCFGIGGEEGEFPFYMTDFAGLNSFKKENIEYNEFLVERDTGKKETYEIRNVVNIQIKKLPDVIAEYCDGKWPDFLSIDIEGMEFESLSICDLSDGPKLMAVEVNYNGDLFVKMMDEKGYFPYLWYRENILFVRKDMKELVYAHDAR